MGDVECIADRFAEFCPESGDLELKLSVEVKDSVQDRQGIELQNECVEWHYYYVHTKFMGKDIIGELGCTLYDVGDAPKPRHPEGDEPVVRGMMRFMKTLQDKGIRAKIIEDRSTLFDDVGTLNHLYLKDAIVCAGTKLTKLHLEFNMSAKPGMFLQYN